METIKIDDNYIGYLDRAEFDQTQADLNAAEENINAMRRANKECMLCGNDSTVGIDEDGNYLCDLHD